MLKAGVVSGSQSGGIAACVAPDDGPDQYPGESRPASPGGDAADRTLVHAGHDPPVTTS